MAEGITFYFDWEVRLIELLQSLFSGFGVHIATLLTYLGEKYVTAAIPIIIYWCIDKEFGRYMSFSLCTGSVFNSMIKNVVLRRRPYFDNPTIKCLKPPEADADIYDISVQSFSFPSGHSANSAITFGGLAIYTRRRRFLVAALILPLLVALSRVILGVHYPTDVLTGLVLGVAIAYLSLLLFRKIKRTWLLYLVVFVISCTGFFYCRTTDYYSTLGIMGGFFAGDLFERRFVDFEMPDSVYKGFLRVVWGFALFFAVNSLIKLPFPSELLSSATTASFAIRFFRYLIATFISIGLYPMLFKRLDRVCGGLT